MSRQRWRPVAAVTCLAWAFGALGAATATRATEDPALRLSYAGRKAEALKAADLGLRVDASTIARKATELAEAGRAADAIGYCELFFDHFVPDMRVELSYLDPWVEVARCYVKLLREHPEQADDERRRQSDAEALALFVRYLERRSKIEGAGETDAMAVRLIERHPKSVFAGLAAGIWVRARMHTSSRGPDEPGRAIGDVLRRMREAGVPESETVLTLLAWPAPPVPFGADYEWDDERRDNLDHAEEILRATDNMPLRRDVLLRLASRAARRGEVAEAWALLRRHRDEAAPGPYGDASDSSAVAALLRAGRADLAERWALDEAGGIPAANVGGLLAAIAAHREKHGDYDEAIRLLRRAQALQPAHHRKSYAGLSLARLYFRTRRYDEAVKLLEEAAAAPPIERMGMTIRPPWQSDAHEMLAQYHMARRNWAEAHKHWKAWRPDGGGCGNAQIEYEYAKDYNLALCLLRSGRPEEALPVVEDRSFNSWHYAGLSMILLTVDVYRALGKLDELDARLRTGLTTADLRYRDEYRLGIEYVAMIERADRGDVEGLWKHLSLAPAWQEYGTGKTYDWRARRAAILLAGMRDRARPLALEQAATTDPGSFQQQWALALLARWEEPDGMPLLARHLRDGTAAPEACCAALATIGNREAMWMLDREARKENPRGAQQIARQILHFHPAPWAERAAPPDEFRRFRLPFDD